MTSSSSNSDIIIRLRQSSLRNFRRCPRMFKLATVDRLASKRKPPALSIGTACHVGRAEWLRSFDQLKAIEATVSSMNAECVNFPSLRDAPATLLKDGRSHAANCRCYACVQMVAVDTMVSYVRTYEQRFSPNNVRILAVEQPFEVEVMKYENLVLLFEGTIDAVAQLDDMYFNFEFKTTKLDISQFIRTERMSIQHTVYPYQLERRIHGNKFHGTLLDVARKSSKTQAATFGHDVIPKNDEDYDEFERDAFEYLVQIARAMDSEVWPKNTDACRSIYGVCAYLPICESRGSKAAMQDYYVVDEDLTQTQRLTEEEEED